MSVKPNPKNVNSISVQRAISSGALKGEHVGDSFSEPGSDTLSWCIAANPSTSANTFLVDRRLILCLFPLTPILTSFELAWSAGQLCFPTCTHLPARTHAHCPHYLMMTVVIGFYFWAQGRFTVLLLTWTHHRALVFRLYCWHTGGGLHCFNDDCHQSVLNQPSLSIKCLIYHCNGKNNHQSIKQKVNK